MQTAPWTLLYSPVNRTYRIAEPSSSQSFQPCHSPALASATVVQLLPSSETSTVYRWTRCVQSQFSSRRRVASTDPCRSVVIQPGVVRFQIVWA